MTGYQDIQAFYVPTKLNGNEMKRVKTPSKNSVNHQIDQRKEVEITFKYGWDKLKKK